MPQAGAVPGEDTYVVVTVMDDAGVGVVVAGAAFVVVVVAVAATWAVWATVVVGT